MTHATALSKLGHQLPARTTDTGLSTRTRLLRLPLGTSKCSLGALQIAPKKSQLKWHEVRQFNSARALDVMGMCDGSGHLLQKYDRALATYVSLFLHPPTEYMRRIPNMRTIDYLLDHPDERTKSSVRYQDKHLDNLFSCVFRRVRSRRYGAVLRKLSLLNQISEPSEETRQKIDALKMVCDQQRAHDPDHPAWARVLKHLLGGSGNQLFLEFLQEMIAGQQAIRYVVVDIDDHACDPTVDPRPPTPRMTQLMELIFRIPALSKPHLIFTSPSGRGRHLYYFIRPMTMQNAARYMATAISTGVPGQKVVGIDLFPSNPAPVRLPFATLPLARGSYLCDDQGNPVEHSTAKALLRIDEYARSETWQPMEITSLEESPLIIPSEVSLLDLESLATSGLTDRGQRWAVLRHLCQRELDRGRNPNEVIAFGEHWLRTNHRGRSADYNADPDAAIAQVRVIVRMLVPPDPGRKIAYRASLREYRTGDVDCMIRRAASIRRWQPRERRRLLEFAIHFAAHLRKVGIPKSDDPNAVEAAVSHSIRQTWSSRNCPIFSKKLGLCIYRSSGHGTGRSASYSLSVNDPGSVIESPSALVLYLRNSALLAECDKLFFSKPRDRSIFFNRMEEQAIGSMRSPPRSPQHGGDQPM